MTESNPDNPARQKDSKRICNFGGSGHEIPQEGRLSLASAAREYDRAGSDRGLQIEAMLHSLGSALNVFLDQGVEKETLSPLRHLFSSLSRLAAGHNDDVLRPLRAPQQSGKPEPDGATKLKQIYILTAADILFRGFGEKRGSRIKADAQAAKICRVLQITAGRGAEITRDMIRNWRSRASRRTHDMYAVKERVDMILSRALSEYSIERAANDASKLLQQLKEIPGV